VALMKASYVRSDSNRAATAEHHEQVIAGDMKVRQVKVRLHCKEECSNGSAVVEADFSVRIVI
jgi:hypothetical protein